MVSPQGFAIQSFAFYRCNSMFSLVVMRSAPTCDVHLHFILNVLSNVH